jgi:hypothetical protein
VARTEILIGQSKRLPQLLPDLAFFVVLQAPPAGRSPEVQPEYAGRLQLPVPGPETFSLAESVSNRTQLPAPHPRGRRRRVPLRNPACLRPGASAQELASAPRQPQRLLLP